MTNAGRWVLRIVAGVMVLAILAWLATMAIGYVVAEKLTHPARKPISTSPAAYGLKYENIRFPSRVDHLMLSGWLIPAARPTDRIVIEAHGYRQNRALDHPALPVAKALHDAGFAVLMFDFRDEGESPGTEVTVGDYELRDLLGAIDYAHKLGYGEVGLIGYSMGASTALEATAADPSVNATIADSPFDDLETYLQQNLSVWTNLPSFPFNGEILWEVKHLFGLDPNAVDPLKQLASAKPRPILLIAGTADTIIPPSNSEALYDELHRRDPEDTLWLVPGAQHVGAYDVEPKAYLERVVDFFEAYMPVKVTSS
ncbi:MAG: alpha/beta fold hydrolase [Alicyclobacillus mali]|uniref:alpha/beta hydrolase n=1 Tax=Alicyclobacillus mali (ex Roth et al. 2021) TaxID=1123961 RepID=UPI001A8FF1FA|nr:alpha/beta fold hydrolase [Alicyclobacillus mali (ex Roth et al. 2021)]MCL6490015.1 alpha/beta fold hydrolase [Alicyclobacillus mali (ex Roth et al. 2021)]